MIDMFSIFFAVFIFDYEDEETRRMILTGCNRLVHLPLERKVHSMHRREWLRVAGNFWME